MAPDTIWKEKNIIYIRHAWKPERYEMVSLCIWAAHCWEEAAAWVDVPDRDSAMNVITMAHEE